MVDFSIFTFSFATVPVALANCPLVPNMIYMLCMLVPKGILVEVDYSF